MGSLNIIFNPLGVSFRNCVIFCQIFHAGFSPENVHKAIKIE